MKLRRDGYNNRRKRHNVTQRQWYRWATSVRYRVKPADGPTGQNFVFDQDLDFFSPVFHAGSLFQQFLVDGFAAIEETELRWIRKNQKSLRADLYSGLVDSINARDADPVKLGKRVVLPSFYTSSPRAMGQLY